MSITYTWNILSIAKQKVGNKDEVVVKVNWQKVGTDRSGNTGICYGISEFDTVTMNFTNFVPYNNLTEEIVLN